jgi:predicted outer membrane protein
MSTLSRRIATAGVMAGLMVGPAVASAPAAARDHHRHATADHRSIARDISDARFLAKAAQANRFEIVAGQLAQERARSAAVKELGAMLVKDHTAALAQGTAVAKQLGIPVPEGISPAQQAQVDRLSQLSGRRFDRAWLKAQELAHVQAVNLHLRGALYGDSQAVRDLAIAGLPVVTRHLSEVLQILRGGSAGHHRH